MGCLFSVVQYVADNLAEDRISVGIVAIDEDGEGRAGAFLARWNRVRHFAGGSTAFLEDFVRELRERTVPSGPLIEGDLTVDDLRQMSHDYQNLIRVTEPAYVDMAATEWVRDFAPLFVRDLDAEATRQDDRKVRQDEIAAKTRQLFRDILASRFHLSGATNLVEKTSLPSKRGAVRDLDAAIVNHGIHFGSIAVTLDHELPESQGRVDHVVRSVQDIRAEYGIPMLVVIDPETTVSISAQHRSQLERQLTGYCGDSDVPVFRWTQPERIESAVAEAMTPERIRQLRAGRN